MESNQENEPPISNSTSYPSPPAPHPSPPAPYSLPTPLHLQQ